MMNNALQKREERVEKGTPGNSRSRFHRNDRIPHTMQGKNPDQAQLIETWDALIRLAMSRRFGSNPLGNRRLNLCNFFFGEIDRRNYRFASFGNDTRLLFE